MKPSRPSARAAAAGQVLNLPIAKVRPLADQPRTHFDQVKLTALAESIRELGQLTAIQVVALPEGSPHDYELIEGERRLRAMRKLGRKTIRAEVQEVRDRTQHWLQSFVANMGREGYTPMETSRGLQRMCNAEPYASMPITRRNDTVGLACGHTGHWVASHLLLLRLDPKVQAMMEPGAPFPLRSSVASAIARAIQDPAKQVRVAKQIVDGQLVGPRAQIAIRTAASTGDAPGPGKGHGRGRRPSDDIAVVRSAAARLEVSVDVINSIPKTAFDRFVVNAGPEKVRELKLRLQRVARELDILVDAIGKVEGG